jgi:hypothetical protein
MWQERQGLPYHRRGLRKWQRPILVTFSNSDVRMFEQSALTIAALFASLLVAAPTLAVAQGSAGGSIGNDDKSLSGSRPEPRSVEPEGSARRTKPQEEELRHSAPRAGGGGSFDGAWVVVSVGCGGPATGAVVVTSGRTSARAS